MPRTNRSAFTLIELLVGIGIIGILTSILLPTLGGARSAAQTAKATAIQRQLAQGTATYSEFANEWLPGVNSSGMRLAAALRGPNPNVIDSMSDFATQDVDWMTPSIDPEGLPKQRAARMVALFERYADPSLGRYAELYESFETGPSGYDDMRAYLEEEASRKLVATSYLMPIAFQLYGGQGSFVSHFGSNYHTRYGQYSGRFVPQTNDAIIGSNYRPTTVSVGSPSMKVANATGLRYYNAGDRITTNTLFKPQRMGAFATWGAMYSGSESYGLPVDGVTGQDQNETRGAQAELVYRHRGKIIATFFDGHAEQLDPIESHNPSLWYPRGSTMGNRGTSIMETAFEYVEEGDSIP